MLRCSVDPQVGPRWPQRSPRWAQDGPKLTQDGPKLAPEVPKMSPKGPQEGAQIAPKSVFRGLPTSKPKKGDPSSISNADLGRFWTPLGAHMGPMLGPMRAYKASEYDKEAKHKMLKNTCKIQVGLALGGSKRGPCWGQVGLRRAS